jgi:hypothetical protein
VTPPGIKPTTFRPVAWCLNQLRYGVPQYHYCKTFQSAINNVTFTDLTKLTQYHNQEECCFVGSNVDILGSDIRQVALSQYNW